MRTAQDLLSELNASDESPRIEAKRAREAGKSILKTVIAFANEPGLGGGHLLLGVDWEVNDKGDIRYWAAGVPDRDKRKRDLDSLQASNALGRLRDRGLLEKNALHTESPPGERPNSHPNQGNFPLEDGKRNLPPAPEPLGFVVGQNAQRPA